MAIKLKGSLTNEEGRQVVGAGFTTLAEGLGLMERAMAKDILAFNYEQESFAKTRDAKSALFMGKQEEAAVRKKGAQLKGQQITAQSVSGFVAKEGTNLEEIEKTELEVAGIIENIRLTTIDKVNTLKFEAAVADINSNLSKKIGSIQKQTGITKSVIGLAMIGFGAYGSE